MILKWYAKCSLRRGAVLAGSSSVSLPPPTNADAYHWASMCDTGCLQTAEARRTETRAGTNAKALCPLKGQTMKNKRGPAKLAFAKGKQNS